MALTLEESRISNTKPFSEMLNDLQANILKHHGRAFANHIFLSIKKGQNNNARNWIANFAVSKVTSSAKQLIDAQSKKTCGIDGGTVFTLSLSKFAYQKLDISNKITPQDDSFNLGMKNRQKKLEDVVELWDEGFQENIDLLIIIADNNKVFAEKEKDNILKTISDIFDVVKIQNGEVLKNDSGLGIEHFGYVDGISQPIFFDDEVLKQENFKSDWRDEAKLKLALVKDKGGNFEDSYGSYLVFRKLEQNVLKFKTEEGKLKKVKDINGKENDELAGAMIVGRFEDGTEVTNFSNERKITIENELSNDFDYSKDSSASKCPFHSHIRITNPRADIGDIGIDSFTKSVRLVRRGIPYNDIGRKSLEEKPESGVGLLFMCYQSNIGLQFEFIQSDWANKGDIGGHEVGQDGIIGQGSNNFSKELPETWNQDNPKNSCDFSNPKNGFVVTKGGEYFFTPSISFLKSLMVSTKILSKIS